MTRSRKNHRPVLNNQGALPFRTSERKGLLAHAYPWERRLFGGVSLVLLVLASLYVYFVIASIVHVAARQELAKSISKTKSAVSVLETEYLLKTEGITESYALASGYIPAAKQVFVAKEGAVSFHDTH